MTDTEIRLLRVFDAMGPMTTRDAAKRARVNAGTARNLVRGLCAKAALKKVGEGPHTGHRPPWIYALTDEEAKRIAWYADALE